MGEGNGCDQDGTTPVLQYPQRLPPTPIGPGKDFLSRPSIFYDLVNLSSNLLSKLIKTDEQEWNYTCNLGEDPLFHERFSPEYLEQVSAQKNMMELSLKDHLVGR